MNTGVTAGARTHAQAFPHPSRPDWFAVPKSWGPDCGGAPQVQLDRRYGTIVHRSHLPLLITTHPEIAPHLAPQGGGTATASPHDAAARAAFDATTAPNGWTLRGYQHDGRDFIRARRGTLLGDSMRLGKTAQIIASHDPELGPLMVVAPLATREVWLAWFKRRWPEERPVVLDGRTLVHDHGKKPLKPRKDPGFDFMSGDRFDAARLRAAKLIFCHYDILGAWKDLGGNLIGTIVFDEIHIASQRASRRAQAVMYAANRAARVIGATGTPIWNRPAGLYTTLQAIAPGAFGTFFDYAMRYCDAQPGPHGYVYSGASNEIEFKARMAEIMIRRTWLDVTGELPAIERSVEVVPITAKQQFEIEKQAERVRDHGKHTTAVGALARFRRLLAGIKVDAAADVAQRVLDSGEKVVVWAWHHEIAVQLERTLAAGGHPGFVISGRTSQGTREEILNRWRTLPTPAPLCITLAVGQVGIDLSAARQEVFAELDFTPSVVAQAEMRVFSPARPMSASYVIVDHDIDRKILAALQDKCDTAYRMGVPAAESTIGVLAAAFARAADGPDDFDALARAIATAHPDLDDIDDSSHFHGSLWTYDWEEP